MRFMSTPGSAPGSAPALRSLCGRLFPGTQTSFPCILQRNINPRLCVGTVAAEGRCNVTLFPDSGRDPNFRDVKSEERFILESVK